MTNTMNSQPKFIFITGGVVSSLGKGLASASLASLLQSRGFKVRLRKLFRRAGQKNRQHYHRQNLSARD